MNVLLKSNEGRYPLTINECAPLDFMKSPSTGFSTSRPINFLLTLLLLYARPFFETKSPPWTVPSPDHPLAFGPYTVEGLNADVTNSSSCHLSAFVFSLGAD
jgi:hypothetical protein